MRLLLLLPLLLLSLPAHADDWEVKRSPFTPQLVQRYQTLLHKDPDDAFAWKRLTALYKSYRTFAQLESEFKSRAEKTNDFIDLYLYAHAARDRGDRPESIRRYRAALAAGPADPRAQLALADELVHDQKVEARTLYQSALARLDAKHPRRRPVLRKLADLALDEKDVDTARRYFDQLIALDPSDVDTRRELAEALAARGRHAEALAAWRDIEPRLAAQPERHAEAWKRIGELAEAAGDDVAALAAYRKAYGMVPRAHYLRRDTTDKIINIYRKKDDLRSLIAEQEKLPASSRGFTEWETLARLYDEIGDAPGATAAYRKALAADPHALDARKRLIALLDRAGHDDQAILEYQRLIAEAPGEARFQLELAERLARTGPPGRKKAVDLLRQVAARFPRDPSVHSALAELYNRWGDAESAQREQELLARLEPSDESHLVDLGEIYYQRGKKKQAVETWRKLANLGKDKASGMARLADVFGDHEMPGEAVELYEKAIKLQPKDLALRRGLAAAYERVHRTPEAEQIWLQIYAEARDPQSRSLRLEARQRIVAIAWREGRLAQRSVDLKRRFDGPPPDDDFGLLLADAYLKLNRTDDAERTLAALAARAKTPEAKGEAQIGLAQVLKARHKIKEAIAALEKAAELVPARARELYSQIAELSLQLYRDDEALAYAHKAVALAPNDAQAEVRLAEIHEKKEDDDGAIAAYQKALALDPRLHKVSFALARLHLRRGEPALAARRYRDVALHAAEEELVLDAARRAIDLEEYLGTLADLERTLTPLAYLHTQKPVYRKLLIELYDRYGTPLATRAKRGDPAAIKELHRLGEHGLKPLLESLVDGEPAEQRIAVRLLGELSNPSAAMPLLKLADRGPSGDARDPFAGRNSGGAPDIDLRVDAALAAARLSDPKLLPALIKLAGDREKHLRIAALHGLGRSGTKPAIAALTRALGDGSPDVQAVACLGLARPGAAAPPVRAQLRGWLADPAHDARVRAACAITLGANGDAPSVDALAELLRQGNDDAQRAAAWALGAIGDRRAEPALLRATFLKREEVRRVAAEALARIPADPRRSADAAPIPEAAVLSDGGSAGLDLASLIDRLARPSRAAAPRALPTADPAAIADALVTALGRHRDLVLRTLADLDGPPGGDHARPGISLGPLTPDLPGDAERRAFDRLADDVGARIEPVLTRLAKSGDALTRARAVAVLARLSSPSAAAVRLAALDDPAIEVRLAALAAAGRAPAAEPLAARLTPLLASRDWRERAAAADALARLRAPGGSPSIARLLDDPSGFVRERAARALGPFGAPAVPPLADHVREEVPEVRRAIAEALGATAAAPARAPLDRLSRDPDPSVREAAIAALPHLPTP